jgi:hypothetical protein
MDIKKIAIFEGEYLRKVSHLCPWNFFYLFLRGRYCKEMAKNLCLDDYFFKGGSPKMPLFYISGLAISPSH